MESHKHPIGQDEKKKVENVVTQTEYAGEGCEEHYNERVVAIDPNYVTELSANTRLGYGRAIIIGEALATPACRKWRRR